MRRARTRGILQLPLKSEAGVKEEPIEISEDEPKACPSGGTVLPGSTPKTNSNHQRRCVVKAAAVTTGPTLLELCLKAARAAAEKAAADKLVADLEIEQYQHEQRQSRGHPSTIPRAVVGHRRSRRA